MRAAFLPLGIALFAHFLPGQNRTVVPAGCRYLQGNAALSLPLRWSQGTLQVQVEAALLPGLLGRSLQGVRLRRPAFLGEGPYAAVQRTITVRGGFRPASALGLGQDLVLNRPTTLTVLANAVNVAVAATAAPGVGASTGQEFLVVPFSTPLVVTAGNLFLEFATNNGPFSVLADNWVDAVWFEDGVDQGYAATTGDGSCTTLGSPGELHWAGAGAPTLGSTAVFRTSGIPAGTFLLPWLGLDPIGRAPGPTFFGFGGSLGGLSPALATCHQWLPADAVLAATASSAGGYDISVPLSSALVAAGGRIGVQVAWLDSGRPGLPLSVTNGVVVVPNTFGVASRCSSVFFPGTATWSPWLPFVGQMPVLTLDHN